MQVIADLHLHSKYSRAVSPQMDLQEMARWAKIKGIDLLTTTDFTHPLWFREIKANLVEAGEGVYKLKGQAEGPLFIFTTEVACIYSQNGKTRRTHTLIMAPGLEEAEKIGLELGRRGNVMSDGRPIFGFSAQELAKIVLETSAEALIVPAHAWTPHFSVFGSQSGFDSLEECFGDMAKYIYAVETGLSSDPAMNWRIKELDRRSILSFSDAHSGAKLGREATVFETPATEQPSYRAIKQAIMQNGPSKIIYTIEFYPEEGKYHYTGHRNCQICHSPEQTKKLGTACPICGKRLTVGVMHRVEELAKNTENGKSKIEYGKEVRWIKHPENKRPPYVMLVPLLEIIAESLKTGVNSQKAINEYKKLTDNLGPEFKVLLEAETAEINKIAGSRIAEGIKKVRSGDIVVDPGYDGEFGVVKIWPTSAEASVGEDKEQMGLF